MTCLPHITRYGLPGIDRVPYGMHACHFYGNRDQLAAALVPYAIAGLRGNERCLWVAGPSLPAREAVQALRAASDDGIGDAIQAGALRIVDAAPLKGLDLVQVWLEEEERALAEGYAGLRIAGNTSLLAPDDQPPSIEYEQAVTARFTDRRIVMLCSYALAQCTGPEMSDVMQAHHCALAGPDEDWQVLGGPSASEARL